MEETKFTSLLEDFEKAVARLDEILQEKKNDIVRDSAIKRFEIVFDLGWKTLRAFLEEERNISCSYPRACFREAFGQDIIEHDTFWIDVTSMRNYTVHTYKEALAEKVYAGLPKALEYFQKLLSTLKKEK
ncbi:MAG: nucleotidyltransferase substrate binding protein [Parcubacteria group bacterium]|nr:nucleotidyltransferase substrate binding protein [Parcubacteria group bacterium]MBI3075272.1 nucleotidyltransferase substrate binding protein [Parcubacteria group bacterium]